ncbi:hypothetical protein M5D96_002788 [Drosophila gunungcola]|uniref:EF-hand domain-containing protein n=1 Tax=Drosophila gunungcola TaxID=103775 RepID=A0A9Q0BVU7_9MUSC|nr:hypothetical protein M5D96_002788 [Drosophila gunungcola]
MRFAANGRSYLCNSCRTLRMASGEEAAICVQSSTSMQMRVSELRAALLLPFILIGLASGQRVAPGVNPQHYQQVPQHVPQHHPPPPAQHHQPQYQQQVHSAPGEHMQVPIDTSKMSEAELQFHYFKMHDSDNNNKLDGCELIKSLIHWHVKDSSEKPGEGHSDGHADGQTEQPEEHKQGSVYTDKALEDTIDYVLKSMDLNNDGFVDWAEYRKTEANIGKD